MKSRIIQLAAVLFLAAMSGACSTVVNLRNPSTGDVASCQSNDLTIASQQVKQALMTECIDGYTRQGYQVVTASR
jgi:hypothetical protein